MYNRVEPTMCSKLAAIYWPDLLMLEFGKSPNNNKRTFLVQYSKIKAQKKVLS
jgi:hypothetical protein